MKTLLKTVLTPLLLATSMSASASSWFKVEVVIFASNDGSAIGEEFWPEINEIPLKDRTVPLKPRVTDGQAPTAYQSLPTSRHGLRSIKNRLNNSPDYRVLFHEAWMQPVSRTQNPRPIKINAGQILDNGFHELEGYIAVGRGRYLHFRPDVYLSQQVSADALNQAAEAAPTEKLEGEMLLTMQNTEQDQAAQPQTLDPNLGAFPAIPEVLTVQLNQARRMRSKEVHYIDHPLMGILVEIRPL